MEQPVDPKPTAEAKSTLGRREFLGLGLRTAGCAVGSRLFRRPTEAAALPLRQEEPGSPFEAKIIDNLTTYGSEKPFSHTELERLITQLNSEKAKVDPQIYYGTLYISESGYKQFPGFTEDGESLQTFLKRQELILNKMLEESDRVNGIETKTAFALRRLIVVADNVSQDGRPFLPWVGDDGTVHDDILADTDGFWGFNVDLETLPDGTMKKKIIYNPNESAYYSPSSKVDRGLIHEWGHQMLHLPDHYALNMKPTDVWPEELEAIPAEWREYHADIRPDTSPNDLMASVGGSIDTYTALQLRRRVDAGTVHDRLETWDEGQWKFPNEMPEQVTFDFDVPFGNASIDLYRSVYLNRETGEYANPLHNTQKGIEKISFPQTLASDGTITFDPQTILGEKIGDNLYAEDCSFFLRVRGSDSRDYFRWIDVRDLNIPRWQGISENVRMGMSLAAVGNDPKMWGEGWKINYSSGT